MFTTQHHKAIARMVAKLPKSLSKHILIADLSDLLQQDSENFKPDKFLEACHPHECLRSELKWDTEPNSKSECVTFKGTCPVCGKEFEQVFTENEELWDVEKGGYVGMG